jgi:hypothetical protein
MPRKIEITGNFRRDEDEACRLSGSAEREAAERGHTRHPKPKPDPFDGSEKTRKPDPFQDVDLPDKKMPKKPDPFQDVG